MGEEDRTDRRGDGPSGVMQEHAVPERPEDLDLRRARLEHALAQRILVLDGATGTALQAANLTAEDFGGSQLEGCNELLCTMRPDVVTRVHDVYLQAGADIIETNSFGGTPLVLAEYGLASRAFELCRVAARLARQAATRLESEQRPRFVCGSMGPTTKAISVTGGVSFDELSESFRIQALGLMAGGADYLLLETCQDTRNIKAGLLGIKQAFDASGWSLPVAVSVTIETNGTMLAGQDAEALTVSLAHADLLYVGLNCATGPEMMRDHLRTLADLAETRIACVPNAGLPDDNGLYTLAPEQMAEALAAFAEEGWLNLVGGCCGTTEQHVAALARMVAGRSPRRSVRSRRCLVSGLEAVELSEESRPLLIGERTNVLGSRKFKRLIDTGEYEEAAEIGRAQVRRGAQVLDICLQDPDSDERAHMEAFLERLCRLVKVPLMIDTTDAGVMEQALRLCQGKAILNSVNLEDGRGRMDRVIGMAKRFGAALVVGTIDEQGMAVTVERKLEVARRAYSILVDEHGLRPQDIWWDALVFPCATGDEQYLGAAGQTERAITALKAAFPDTRTMLGVSNVSFGLPVAAREVLNSVFLYRCTRAGLDAAIVNTQRLARYADIASDERALAEALLELEPGQVGEGERAVAAMAAHFRERRPAASSSEQEHEQADVALRLARAVVEGSKSHIEVDIEEALADDRWPDAMAIINGPLMAGMGEVGRLFNDNQLIVAEVLQSAEVMKAAVGLLEPHLEQEGSGGRGRVLLATVKGDVHDIGKNLVEIVLGNNGFEVINLGIRVPSEQLVAAVREHCPDVIGLSGLLVKSAHQMVLTAGDLAAAGIDTPLLVGGAALTRRFTHRRIAAAYKGLCTHGRDAMHGLELVERLLDPSRRPGLEAELASLVEQDIAHEEAAGAARPSPTSSARSSEVRRNLIAPTPPDLERHVERLDLEAVWQLLNPQMLYGKHLGLRGSVRRLRAAGDQTVARLDEVVAAVKQMALEGAMRASAVWRFFPARAAGDRLTLLDETSSRTVASWELPRQTGASAFCLADYVLEADHVALLVTTAGVGVRERVEQLKSEGEYLLSHALAALAVETAEAAAELLHERLRRLWGFPDGPEVSLTDKLAARYRGKRYSFGYPACPELSHQEQLFAALEPEDIGVRLTESFMMDPEASVSALVFHHPEARYFAV